jgi:hypothetical protein
VADVSVPEARPYYVRPAPDNALYRGILQFELERALLERDRLDQVIAYFRARLAAEETE